MDFRWKDNANRNITLEGMLVPDLMCSLYVCVPTISVLTFDFQSICRDTRVSVDGANLTLLFVINTHIKKLEKVGKAAKHVICLYDFRERCVPICR